MPTYSFPQFDVEIINPIVIKNGHAGGHFIDNVSQGSFGVDIKLQTESASFGIHLDSHDTQPTDFTIEAIDVWIAEQLEQYEI